MVQQYFNKGKNINLPQVLYTTSVMFFLSASVKVIGEEQIRPFLYYAYLLIVLFTILSCIKLLFKIRYTPQPALLFSIVFLLALLMMQSLYAEKAFKNYIMMLGLMAGFPFSTYLYLAKGRVARYVQSLAMAFLIYCFIIIFTAVYMMLGNDIEVLGSNFKHSLSFGFRMSGLAGEPTHFGAIVAIGLLSLIFLYNKKIISHPSLVVILGLIIVSCLLGSGSRNSILSVILSLFIVYGRKIQLKFFLMLVFFVIILTTIFLSYYSDIIEIVTAMFRLDDSSSEDIRINRLSTAIYGLINGNISGVLIGNGFRYDRLFSLNIMSGYMALIYNNGILGFLLYLMVFIYLLVFYKNYKRKDIYLAEYFISLLIFYMIFNIFLDVSLIVVFQSVGLILPISILVLFSLQCSPSERLPKHL